VVIVGCMRKKTDQKLGKIPVCVANDLATARAEDRPLPPFESSPTGKGQGEGATTTSTGSCTPGSASSRGSFPRARLLHLGRLRESAQLSPGAAAHKLFFPQGIVWDKERRVFS